MEFLLTFFEGVLSFISPCMLPMLPVYISYFAADGGGRRHRVFFRVLSFVLGFTAVYTSLGLFAGFLGGFLVEYRTAVNIVGGLAVIFFGLCCLEVIKLSFLKGVTRSVNAGSILSAFVFGIVYSVSLTPCIGVFLGSALTMAASSGTAARGVLLLVTYSLGMGIPFLLSAVLIDRLRGAFGFIKSHYGVINKICGIFLIVVGVLMALGVFDRITAFLR